MGLGAAAAIDSSPTGEVLASFALALYLRFPGGIAVITDPSIPPGPLHVTSDLPLPHLEVGERFAVPAAWRSQVTIWRGATTMPEPGAAALLAPVARQSALLAEPLVARWEAASVQHDLAIVGRLLGGLGPGLTPSGDDALAGIFLATYLRRPDWQPHLVDLAARVDTHEISRAFLTWAARGQSIEPVHRLLAGNAGAAGDLLALGHTSGADLALGLLWGLEAELEGAVEVQDEA